ncbi:unnamed protein product [Polarella glacialis]|uniref:Uncharacterized protein n=1 Tax=Polarella glacialis TaxID=89957 RepID=A0A813EJZ5_POLGL|nr:unnamed protein product [Polarella glacialis]
MEPGTSDYLGEASKADDGGIGGSLFSAPSPCSAELAAAAILHMDPWLAGRGIASCLDSGDLASLFTPLWVPVWRGLDRLTTLSEVNVTDVVHLTIRGQLQPRSRAAFRMALHPPHIRQSTIAESGYWFLSDRIRATRKSYCKSAFQTTAESMVALRGNEKRRLVFMDVGSHLGDCCLWAAARLGHSVRCIAVEMEPSSAALIRRSVALNGFHGEVEIFQGELAGAECPCAPHALSMAPLRGDCLVGGADIDLLHIHTSVRMELSILEGFLSALREGRIRAAIIRAVRTGESREAVIAVATAFVAKHGLSYEVQAFGRGQDVLLVQPGLLARHAVEAMFQSGPGHAVEAM